MFSVVKPPSPAGGGLDNTEHWNIYTVTVMMNCRADELPRQFIAAGNSVVDELPGDDELPHLNLTMNDQSVHVSGTHIYVSGTHTYVSGTHMLPGTLPVMQVIILLSLP